MKYHEVTLRLEALGCTELPRRGLGSHRKWFNPARQKATVLPDFGGEDLNPGAVRSVVLQLGLDWQSFAEAVSSSTTHTVGLRRRDDLLVKEQMYQGEAWFVVKDPISLHYFRFRPEEYALLEMLDGQASLESLKDRFEEQFPPRRITVEELARFVSTLHRSGLVIGDRPRQRPQLFERRRQRQWKEWVAWISNVMALR